MVLILMRMEEKVKKKGNSKIFTKRSVMSTKISSRGRLNTSKLRYKYTVDSQTLVSKHLVCNSIRVN